LLSRSSRDITSRSTVRCRPTSCSTHQSKRCTRDGPSVKAPWCTTAIGSQYVSIRYSKRLAEAGIESSGGQHRRQLRQRDAETINCLYKAEIIHRRGPWKTREAVELATLEWVSWFNHHRLLESIGYIPPAEAETNYWHQRDQAAASTEAGKLQALQEG